MWPDLTQRVQEKLGLPAAGTEVLGDLFVASFWEMRFSEKTENV
jgi:hypothetical protein